MDRGTAALLLAALVTATGVKVHMRNAQRPLRNVRVASKSWGRAGGNNMAVAVSMANHRQVAGRVA